jgi:hypothetical protein
VICDADKTLHARYGAGAEYLIRPDGHVGFRSQPADGKALTTHIERLLVATA